MVSLPKRNSHSEEGWHITSVMWNFIKELIKRRDKLFQCKIRSGQHSVNSSVSQSVGFIVNKS